MALMNIEESQKALQTIVQATFNQVWDPAATYIRKTNEETERRSVFRLGQEEGIIDSYADGVFNEFEIPPINISAEIILAQLRSMAPQLYPGHQDYAQRLGSALERIATMPPVIPQDLRRALTPIKTCLSGSEETSRKATYNCFPGTIPASELVELSYRKTDGATKFNSDAVFIAKQLLAACSACPFYDRQY